MKVHVEVDEYQIRLLIAKHINEKLNLEISPHQVKITLLPIRQRRKHPNWCPITHASVDTDK